MASTATHPEPDGGNKAASNADTTTDAALRRCQDELAALRARVDAAAHPSTQVEIYVAKDTFKFNASHFVAYPGFRERLHGHSYRASVKLLGSHYIGRDGYVLDFGCVKSVAKEVCKEMNEYFIVPMLSEVLTITVAEDGDGDGDGEGKQVCGECDNDADPSGKTVKKRKLNKYPGTVTIECEDGSTFLFPRQDCLLLPIMHSTAEELAIYLYGKILQKLDADHLLQRGVQVMEVTVSEAAGQDAIFRRAIADPEGHGFDFASYISQEAIPAMPCAKTPAQHNRRSQPNPNQAD